MRLSTSITSLVVHALAFFTLPTVLGRPSHDVSTRTQHRKLSRDVIDVTASDAIALRQYHAPRSFRDTCAYVDLDVLNLGILPISLDVELCLCIALLPDLVTVDATLEALVNLLGLDELIAKLTVEIGGSPNAQQCSYPDNCHAICTENEPCGFECNAPYVKEDGQCVCPAPFTSCNGVCGSFPHGCGSAVPHSLSARSDTHMHKRKVNADRIVTLAHAQQTCKTNETVCGIYGRSSTAFECLDVNTHIESCGGCTVPNPFVPGVDGSAIGRDCTAIPGADRVSCVAGQCMVTHCREGWELTRAGDQCVKMTAAGTLSVGVITQVQQEDASVLDSLRAMLDLSRMAGVAWEFVLVRVPWFGESF